MRPSHVRHSYLKVLISAYKRFVPFWAEAAFESPSFEFGVRTITMYICYQFSIIYYNLLQCTLCTNLCLIMFRQSNLFHLHVVASPLMA
jgi:hypothetical protein